MKRIKLLGATLALVIFGCNHPIKSTDQSKAEVTAANPTAANLPDSTKDKLEIQSLVRKMLNWSESGNSINLLPVLSKDSICTGIDLVEVNQNLKK